MLVPEGAAADGPIERVATTPTGIELTAGPNDLSPLKWQITLEPDQRLSRQGSKVFVESADGVKVAEIRMLGGDAAVVDGTPQASDDLSSGDRIVIKPGEGSVEISPVGQLIEDPPCFTEEAVENAVPEEEELEEKIEALYAVTSGAGSTAQIKVWVNPHPAIGNVKVTTQGPCTDHEKYIGEDGTVLFGGCTVGKTFTVSVPEWVHNGPNHYQLGGHARQFILSKAGNTIWFDYRLASTDSPPPPPPPPPPPAEPESGLVKEVSAEEPELGEATISRWGN